MQFKSALSTNPDSAAAVAEVLREIGRLRPDLAVVFVSPHHADHYETLAADLWERLGARNLIGCTAEGIIGPDREVEHAPALAVWAACMPGVRVLPFPIDQSDVVGLTDPDGWHEHLGVSPSEGPGFVVLPDPFTIDVEALIDQLEAAYPGCRVVGGMASGAVAAGQNRLFLNDQVLRQGLVGVSLSGPIALHTVVSQGCRPVGEPFVVTKAHQNVIYELRGRPAIDVLREVFRKADAADQELMQSGLHIGRVVDERLATFGRGDFLIRNVMGVVEEKGLAVTALVRPGQTIQFHVRDAATATEDLKRLLAGSVSRLSGPSRGGLLFSCNGRGTRMFGVANHDISLINSVAGDCPVAGFFAAGEIGPVGNRNFIHGFTSSLVLFEPRSAAPADAGPA